MKRSTNRILSAHVGTLPRPATFPEVYFGEVANRDEFFKALPGHEVYALSDEQLAAWRKSAEGVVSDWEGTVRKAGADPKAILDDLRKTVAAHKAAY